MEQEHILYLSPSWDLPQRRVGSPHGPAQSHHHREEAVVLWVGQNSGLSWRPMKHKATLDPNRMHSEMQQASCTITDDGPATGITKATAKDFLHAGGLCTIVSSI